KLLVYTGGPDINPKHYNQQKGSHTKYDDKRDDIEVNAFHMFRFSSVPKLGIGRGAQLLTALSGGKIIQHVSKHEETSHTCHCFVEENMTKESVIDSFSMNSNHHQMMNPFMLNNEDYDLIAWSKRFLSTTY